MGHRFSKSDEATGQNGGAAILFGRNELTILFACYAVSVLLHVWLLYGVWVAPYIAHDEVQYCLTGENIRAGRGVLTRGEFATSFPPLFPLFVALGHSIPYSPRLGLFVLSVLAICSLLFPMYRIGRYFGLSPELSVAAALSASFLPQTFYAGMYMSEVLHLPLFFLAFWLCLRWLDSGDVGASVVLGSVFGIMALNRIATLTFLVCFVATGVLAIVLPGVGRFRVSKGRAALSLGIVAGVCMVFQGGWWLFKIAHHVSALGTYSTSPAAWGLPPETLFVVYFMDVLLASGIMVAAPFIAGLRRLYRDRLPAAIFFTVTMLTLIDYSDGIKMGFLRERYCIYCFPLIALVALIGAKEYFSGVPFWIGALALFALPLLCLFGMMLYDFHVPPLVESSWAYAVSALTISDHGVFDRNHLLWNGCIVIGIFGTVLVAGRRRFPAFLAGSVLLFNVYAFACVGHGIATVTAGIATRTADMLKIFPQDPRPLQKVIMAGFPAAVDNRFIPQTPRFLEANTAAGLTDDAIWYMEIMRLLDVRMCASPYCVLNPRFAGAYLLSAVDFPNLELVNTHGTLYLHRIPSLPDGTADPPTYIPAKDFRSTELTERTPDGSIVGKESNQSGVLVFGPYRTLSPGLYEVTVLLNRQSHAPIRFEIVNGAKILEWEDAPADKLTSLRFAAESSDPFEFRIQGVARRDFVFQGARLRSVATGRNFAAVDYTQKQSISADQFLTRIGERLADGGLSSRGRTGFLCYGPYRPLAAGKYRITFHIQSSAETSIHADVAGGNGTVLASADAPVSRLPELEFSTDGKTPLEYRLVTGTGPDVKFTGVRIVQTQ
jgi:hypothetical protein